ncbi:MAG TPA: CHRD domain-containing protein [Terriglobales bacterium]|nr:CHRD domain-containing protein [Terriglobales bacterium]
MRRLLVSFFALFLLTAVSHADQFLYYADLTGAAESPSNASAGTGSTLVTYDSVAHTLRVEIQWSGLSSGTTASHIHCCVANPFDTTLNAPVATQVPRFVGFPTGVTSGSYDHLFDLTDAASWNATFITANGGSVSGAESALAAGMAAGKAYLNIHTTNYPGGEIRGFLAPAPEPASMAIFGSMLAGLIAVRRKSK